MTLSRIPFVLPFGGFTGSHDWPEMLPAPGIVSVSIGGRLTLDEECPAFPDGHPEIYYPLPANALHDDSPGGWYRLEVMSPRTATVHERYEPQREGKE